MSETFIELVPKNEDMLRTSMTEIEASGIPLDGYNLPELGSTALSPEEIFRLRSEGKLAQEKQLAVHLRTRDRSRNETLERMQIANSSGVNIILLVTGDAKPSANESGVHAHDVLEYVNASTLKIGVAADLYQREWGRWDKKASAIRQKIVHRVFTQPVFHPSVLEAIREKTSELLTPQQTYVGITWMSTQRSRRYWHEQNAVPLDHLPCGESEAEITRNSLSQAADVLKEVRAQGYSMYIMLMRNTVKQLEEVLSLSENIREL